jgi:hypothetical protein
MKFQKGERVLWNGQPAIIYGVIKKFNNKVVKWYEVKRNENSVASHLVSEDAGTLEKMEAK